MTSLRFRARSRFSLKAIATIFTLSLVLIAGVWAPAHASRPSPLLYPQSGWVTIGAGQSGSLYSTCSSDRYTLGGGFETEGISGNSFDGFKIVNAYPADYRTWRIRLRNTDDVARRVKIYNICAKTSDFR
ncbi:MAG: hypothetical protein AAFV85_03395 [Cyanobacteria bacterium J06634_6]|mgnify:FL=1